MPRLVTFLVDQNFVFGQVRVVGTKGVQNLAAKLGSVFGDDDTIEALVLFACGLEFDFQHRGIISPSL